MTWAYVLAPCSAWVVAGSLKFLINSVRAKKLAIGLIGYGGLPSNHSAIVSSTASLIGLSEGVQSPAFGIALTLAFIVILDATSLRRQVGEQASAINRLRRDQEDATPLRERMGHTRLEVLCGVLTGIAVALTIHSLPI